MISNLQKLTHNPSHAMGPLAERVGLWGSLAVGGVGMDYILPQGPQNSWSGP